MKLLLKKKFLSWSGRYEIYDENGEQVFTGARQPKWGYCFKVFDADKNCIGMVKEKMFLIVPQEEFEVYKNGNFVGCIRQKFKFFNIKSHYNVDFNDWSVEGGVYGLKYKVYLGETLVACFSKKRFHLTDTYELDVARNEDALDALLLAAVTYRSSLKN